MNRKKLGASLILGAILTTGIATGASAATEKAPVQLRNGKTIYVAPPAYLHIFQSNDQQGQEASSGEVKPNKQNTSNQQVKVTKQ